VDLQGLLISGDDLEVIGYFHASSNKCRGG
jgi:hypothetical protein